MLKEISYTSQMYINISKIYIKKILYFSQWINNGLFDFQILLLYSFYYILSHYIWVTRSYGSTTSLIRIWKLNENIVPDWNNNNRTAFKYFRYLIINLFNIWVYGHQKKSALLKRGSKSSIYTIKREKVFKNLLIKGCWTLFFFYFLVFLIYYMLSLFNLTLLSAK